MVLHFNKSIFYLNFWFQKSVKKVSPAGNRTPVSRVTGGDTDHYTTEDLFELLIKFDTSF